MDKSITNHNIFLQVQCCKFGYCCNRFWNFLFLFKLHKCNKIQYAAVTQNINTILYDCTLPNLQINIVNYLHECELQ